MFDLAGLSMAALFDLEISLSQSFEELQGSNSDFKLTIPKSFTGTYFETTLSIIGLADLPMAAILDFYMFISQLFEELEG